MRIIKNQKGFTLIEMLIVMLIITVLIAIAIPNVTKQSTSVDQKGCKAFVHIISNIYIRLKLSVLLRVSEVGEKQLIVLAISRGLKIGFSIAYFAQKNKEAEVLIELPTLLELLNNRNGHDVKHFHDFFDVSILSFLYGDIKEQEESFNRIQTVEALFFIVSEGKPINLTNLIVRLRRANAENTPISSFKLFLVSVDDEWRELPLKVRWDHWLVAARVILFTLLGGFK